MEKEKTMNYEAPRIEVIEVEVEKGFATSGTFSTTGYEEVDWDNN